jgi:hypothetical protein
VSKAPTADPYLDPVSGVLRNLLGITDPAELAEAEAALSASRLVDLERRRDSHARRPRRPAASGRTAKPGWRAGRLSVRFSILTWLDVVGDTGIEPVTSSV